MNQERSMDVVKLVFYVVFLFKSFVNPMSSGEILSLRYVVEIYDFY